MKANPFQRSNPFQVQGSYQPQISTSFNSYQSKPSHHIYQPQLQSFTQKQNTYLKKADQQVWKFRQDNCGKVKVFSHQSNYILNEKYLQQKNSFQKQLVLSNVGKRNNNNSGQQSFPDRQKIIGNPFDRKYLIGGNPLAQSQVYAGFTGASGQQNIPTYDRYKSQYDNYTPKVQYNTYNYSNYVTPTPQTYANPVIPNIGSNNNLETSLHYKYDIRDQYESQKSIPCQDSYNRSGSYKNVGNPIQSRYSLERQKESKYFSGGSNRDIYPPYPSMKDNNSKVSRISGTEKDGPIKGFSRVSQKDQRVKFQSSDDQDSPQNQSRNKQRQPTFGSKKQIPQLIGPSQIIVNGCKFYRQKLECY